MRRTDLSRPSFYVYFRDRHHLVLRVVEHIGGELRTMAERWYRAAAGPGAGRARRSRARRGLRAPRARAARARRRGRRRPATSSWPTARSSGLRRRPPPSTSRPRSRPGACCRSTPRRPRGRSDLDDGALPADRLGRNRRRSSRDRRGRHADHDLDPRALRRALEPASPARAEPERRAAERGRRRRAHAAARRPAAARRAAAQRRERGRPRRRARRGEQPRRRAARPARRA